jgi:anti-sigma factor RsiW
MHPDIETLVRYRDGELPPAERTELDLHVSRCDACRLHLHQLFSVLAEVRRQPVSSPHPEVPGTLDSLSARIQQWQKRRRDPAMSAEAIRSRVARELGPFLGSQGAHRILNPITPECRNLLCAVEPVLAHFLGARAATELMDHVVDIAIAGI